MSKVKWRCPQCQRVFNVTQGREPALCPDCQEKSVRSHTAAVAEMGVPEQRAHHPAIKFSSRPLALGLSIFAGWLLIVAGLFAVVAGTLRLFVGESPEERTISVWMIVGGLSAINVAGVPSGLAYIAKTISQTK